MGKVHLTRITTPFDGYKGWEHNGKIYHLAVGCGIAETADGELLATTMTGGDTEPCDDHITVIMRSKDRGQTWSEPEELLGNVDGLNGSASFFRVDGRTLFDGKNYLELGRWPAAGQYTEWHYTVAPTTDGARTWAEEKPINKHDTDEYNSGFGNITRTSKGELLCCGTCNIKRKTPLTAGVERLLNAKSEEEALAMEPIKEGESSPMDFAGTLFGLICFEVNEDFTEFKPRGNIVCNRPLGLLEGHIMELKDGTLTMIARAEWGGFLWRTDSHDGGYTWCDAYPTDIPNPSSQARFLRLPDGRIACFNNACGEIGKRGPRNVLSVWVSNDEMKTWYIKEDIIVEEAYMSYPGPRILSDGTICFGYDHNRRRAVYVEIEIPPME